MTPAQIKFADAILVGCSPSEAYRSAYDVRNTQSRVIAVRAAELQKVAGVAEYIQQARSVVAARIGFSVEDVLNEWITIATADPQELIRTRTRACRHCHGAEHRYQWRDEAEWMREVSHVLEWKPRGTMTMDDAPLPPDNAGGYGYNVDLPPADDCPECNGLGTVDVMLTPTRDLSPGGRKLYAGIKQTKDGLQVLMRDQDAALNNLAKYHGMLVEKRELTGKNGGPVVMQVGPQDETL